MPETLAIVINYCVAFSSTTLTVVLESLRAANVPMTSVVCILGEASEESIDTSNGYTLIHTRYCNVDNTAAVYLTQTDYGRTLLQTYTHVFYTHDTVRFLETFWATIHTYLPTCTMYRKLQAMSSKSMGLLNSQWFLREKSEVMRHLANTDPQYRYAYKTSQNIPNEAQIRASCARLPQWLNEDVLFDFTDTYQGIGDVFATAPVPTHFEDVYHTGEERKAYVYTPPGLIKYQRNYAITSEGWKLNL